MLAWLGNVFPPWKAFLYRQFDLVGSRKARFPRHGLLGINPGDTKQKQNPGSLLHACYQYPRELTHAATRPRRGLASSRVGSQSLSCRNPASTGAGEQQGGFEGLPHTVTGLDGGWEQQGWAG
jgi:hypothetical protein